MTRVRIKEEKRKKEKKEEEKNQIAARSPGANELQGIALYCRSPKFRVQPCLPEVAPKTVRSGEPDNATWGNIWQPGKNKLRSQVATEYMVYCIQWTPSFWTRLVPRNRRLVLPMIHSAAALALLHRDLSMSIWRWPSSGI